jgi:hypothetical protein
LQRLFYLGLIALSFKLRLEFFEFLRKAINGTVGLS